MQWNSGQSDFCFIQALRQVKDGCVFIPRHRVPVIHGPETNRSFIRVHIPTDTHQSTKVKSNFVFIYNSSKSITTKPIYIYMLLISSLQ